MIRRTASLALLVTLATASPGLQALGLAEPEVRSSLSEPLRARIALSDLQGLDPSHLRVRLADTQAFTQAGVPRSALAESVQLALSQKGGQLSVMLSTDKPVDEPYLDLLLALEWPNGTLQRQVTLLLDPPGYASTAALIDNGQATSTETAHAVRVSPLPSGSLPRRAQGLPATESGQLQRVEVKPGDTLWRIAERVARPADVSIEQAMMALFRANPAAFPGGNINDLRAGVVLDVPAPERLLADAANALQQVDQQNQAWHSASREDTAPDESQAPHLTLLSDAELAAEAIAAGNIKGPMPQSDQATTDDEAARLEALEANWQASREVLAEVRVERDRLQEEIASLREDMASLRDMLNQSMAAAPTMPVEAAAETASPVASPLATATPLSASQVASAAAVSAQDTRPGLWQGIWQGIVDQASLIGGGGIVLLLLAWAIVRRRSQRDPVDSEPDFSFQQAMGDSGVPDFVEKVPAPVAMSSVSPADNTPQAETINEADIFIAYGRYEQARDLLEKSLESEPERHDLRLKLLIACTELGLRDASEQQARQLLEHAGSDYRVEVEQIMARFEQSDTQDPADKDAEEALPREDASTRLLEETARVEDALDEVISDVERIIDYEPPSLEPDHAPRRDELQQSSIEFHDFPEIESAGPAKESSPLERLGNDTDWDIEEVAFEPLNLDNDQPATDTTKIKPQR